MPKTEESWEHGYVRVDSEGKRTYYIRCSVAGKRWDFSTRCHNAIAAGKVYQRFEQDPHGYAQTGGRLGEALPLDKALALEFLTWSRDTKGNTLKHVNEQKTYILWWMKALANKDLRKLNLGRDILIPLEEASCGPQKVRTLKTLFTWLRTVKHAVKPAEDATLDALKAPQSHKAQLTKTRAAPEEEFLLIRGLLPGHWRDGMTVLGGTGWHVTELVKFVVLAECGLEPDNVLLTKHKTKGEPHRSKVSDEVYQAAGRLKERGTFADSKFRKAVREAAQSIGSPFRIGSTRHTVATLAINKGSSIDEVSTFMKWKDRRTALRYTMHAVPGKIPTPL